MVETKNFPMRRLPLIFALIAALAAWPSPAATAQVTFTFAGGGYGHGLGMSQWGAYGLAKQGWTAGDILGLYYSGTAVASVASPGDLRIGLTNGRTSLGLEAVSGDAELSLDGSPVAVIPEGETWTLSTDGATFIIEPPVGEPIAATGADVATPLVATYDGGRVRIAEVGRSYTRGTLEFGLHLCGANCLVRAVVVVDPEDYLYGLGEVPSSWPDEAMRAQAIAARSYAYAKALANQHRSPCDCALYANTLDQVYVGWDKEAGTDGDRWMAAVDATAGQVVTYEGAVIQAFYMSSSGGHTEDNEKVWGGTPLPYLRGVCDPGDYTTANPSAVWTVSKSAADVTAALGLSIGTVTGFEVTSRGVSGRILSVTVRGDAGEATMSGGTLRSKLGLRDTRFWIDQDRLVTGDVRARYDALDCALGLPTSRFATFAGGQRQRFELGAIYRSPAGVLAAVWGDVYARYVALRGPRGDLGFPITDVTTLPNGAERVRFERGRITCREGTCREKVVSPAG